MNSFSNVLRLIRLRLALPGSDVEDPPTGGLKRGFEAQIMQVFLIPDLFFLLILSL
jgi:hypothetical protein